MPTSMVIDASPVEETSNGVIAMASETPTMRDRERANFNLRET
ncbi:MAG TPA: hypothetical protein VF018_12930 [Acidobacteriaceae bacterium]